MDQNESRRTRPNHKQGRAESGQNAAGRKRRSREGLSQEQLDARARYIRKKKARQRRQKIITIVIVLILILGVVGAAGLFVLNRYSPTDEKADLNEYYGIEESDELAVVINNFVVRNVSGDPVSAKSADGQAYIEYSVVRKNINSRFYWDSNESVMLYTLPTGNVMVTPNSTTYTELGEEKSEDYTILITDGSTAYIAVPFIQQYTNMEYGVYEDPGRVCITSEWGTVNTAAMNKDTQVRYQGGVKSPVLTDVSKGDKVTVLEDESDWMRVSTADGFIGYVKTSTLDDIAEEETSREFTEPDYTHIKKDYAINLAWNNVESEYANSFLEETLANVSGINTIAPTWYYVADTDGDITSIATSDYVEYAHQLGLEVWPTLRDFNGGINSYDETYETLSYTSKRQHIIDQVISDALSVGVDGINLDFELISLDCGAHYVQFVRELSVACRQNGLVLSIDNYVPQAYNEHQDLKEQAAVADYVVIMAYDEYTNGSETPGPVASYSYVENGVTDALEMVSADQLVLGLNFYSRIWTTHESDGQTVLDTSTLTMSEVADTLSNAGVTASEDAETSLNYAEWTSEDGSKNQLWIEDKTSLEKKLKLIGENNLAGVAEWKLGQETSDVWELFSAALK